VKGDDQLAALVAVYGPRTTMLLTIGDEVVEFLLNGSEDFVLSRERLVVKEEGKMFAPGNLRACKTNEGYKELMNYWCAEQYTLRYSGGMVPDINQILIKGKGVFTYPGYEAAPEGKLRVLYECAPMALLMERAGGLATDGNRRILEIEVGSLDQRTPVLMGSIKEVQKAEEYLAR
jgi:fructose-1,6-bisphosphatase I